MVQPSQKGMAAILPTHWMDRFSGASFRLQLDRNQRNGDSEAGKPNRGLPLEPVSRTTCTFDLLALAGAFTVHVHK